MNVTWLNFNLNFEALEEKLKSEICYYPCPQMCVRTEKKLPFKFSHSCMDAIIRKT